jgi:fatty acid desaturase
VKGPEIRGGGALKIGTLLFYFWAVVFFLSSSLFPLSFLLLITFLFLFLHSSFGNVKRRGLSDTHQQHTLGIYTLQQ